MLHQKIKQMKITEYNYWFLLEKLSNKYKATFYSKW